jgi:hypothetical protein
MNCGIRATPAGKPAHIRAFQSPRGLLARQNLDCFFTVIAGHR